MSQRRSPVDNVETMAQIIAGLLPSLALEARISGGNPIGDQLVTQLGLSVQAAQNVDMAILARTSGTAFVVGIGSIMAYKLFCRLAKSNCLWSSIDQLIQQQCSSLAASSATAVTVGDDPASSPSKTVQLTDGFYAVRLGGENELLRKLDECFCRKDSDGGAASSASSNGGGTVPPPEEQLAVVQVRHGRHLRRLIRQNQRLQREGIEALQEHDQHGVARGVLLRAEQRRQQHRLRRDDDEESVISDISNLTSASRIPPNPNAVDRVPPLQLPPDDERRASAALSSTPISALLHFPNADELCWENEFSSASEAGDDLAAAPDGRPTDIDEMGDTEGLFLFRERCNSLGSISQLSAMKNLERMFRGVSSDWHGGDTNLAECHGTDQKHRPVDSALDNLRDLDRLDANTNVSSSMLSSGRMARRCWLDMEGAGTRGPGSAAYKIAGSKSDLDISEMSTSSICSRPQMIAIQHQKQLKQKHQQQQHKSHGLWELTSLNFAASTPAVDEGRRRMGGCAADSAALFYSRFAHEKHNGAAPKCGPNSAAAAATTAANCDGPNGQDGNGGSILLEQQRQQRHHRRGNTAEADDATNGDGEQAEEEEEEEGILSQCQQQQQSMLLTPLSSVTAASSSTMVDSVISCHSSLASTSAFSAATRQRSSNSGEMMGGSGGVMFDSAIVSDGGAQSNLGLGHEHDDDDDEQQEGMERNAPSAAAQTQRNAAASDGIIRRFYPPASSTAGSLISAVASEHSTPVTSHKQRLSRRHRLQEGREQQQHHHHQQDLAVHRLHSPAAQPPRQRRDSLATNGGGSEDGSLEWFSDI